jgi:hypothetical protein
MKIRSIEIDDSGIGSLLGGMVLVFTVKLIHSKDTQYKNRDIPLKNYVHVIPTRYFQEYGYWSSLQNMVVNVYQNAFKEIEEEIPYDLKQTKIKVCRGPVHHQGAFYLEQQGYAISRGVIAGYTQDLAERSFASYLERACHYPHVFIQKTKGKNLHGYLSSYSQMLSWIAEDLNRTRWAKTGWGQWPKIHQQIIHQHVERENERHRYA